MAQRRLAAIVARNPTGVLLDTVRGVQRYYPEFDVVVIDSDSTDISMYAELPPGCRVEYAQNKNWELGAWKYVYQRYPDYAVYLFLQDTLTPTSRIEGLDPVHFNNDNFYSCHYRARIASGGYLEELRRIYEGTPLDFIARLPPHHPILGTAFNSYLGDRKSIGLVVQLEDAYTEKQIAKTRMHCWLAERTGGILPDRAGMNRIDMMPHFHKTAGNRDPVPNPPPRAT